jgi:hypothetical protein
MLSRYSNYYIRSKDAFINHFENGLDRSNVLILKLLPAMLPR